MKKITLATALALLITGCAQQTFTVQNKPTLGNWPVTAVFLRFCDWAEEKHDAAKICSGAENVVKASNKHFVNGLLGFITLGIYTPLEARVYCSQ